MPSLELPYFSYQGDLAYVHGKFNNSLSTLKTTRRNLEHLTGLYDLDLFSLRPDQFNFREHGFFSKFEMSVGRKKRKIKKIPQFFALALIINKNFL